MSISTFLSLTVTLLLTYFHSHPIHTHPIYSFFPLTSIMTPLYLYSLLYIYTTLQHQVQTLISSTIQASIISSTQSLPLCLQCHLGIPFNSQHRSGTHISLYLNYMTPYTCSTLNTQTTCQLIMQPVGDRCSFLTNYLFSSLFLFTASISTFINHNNNSLINYHSVWHHVCLVSLIVVVSQDVTKCHGTVT